MNRPGPRASGTGQPDWQFRQVVDALEILLNRALALGWATGFDWAYWRSSARRLESSHATIARDTSVAAARVSSTGSRRLGPRSGPRA
jgi:hypothetical protein